MTNYAIDGDDKCYTPVYSKEDIKSKLKIVTFDTKISMANSDHKEANGVHFNYQHGYINIPSDIKTKNVIGIANVYIDYMYLNANVKLSSDGQLYYHVESINDYDSSSLKPTLSVSMLVLDD